MKTKTQILNTAKTTIATGIFMLLANAFPLNATGAEAEKKADAPAKTGNSDEIDISDIQSQYWKSHDKEFEVIQNKVYTKSGRVEIAPLFGIYQRVDFQDVKTLGGAVAYHFSEILGTEIMVHKMLSSDSSTLTRFKETRGATIEFNKEKLFIGGSILFTPIYAKFSFLGKKISHFDMYITAGGGVTQTNAYRPTISAGVGQKFWITPHWNVRLEYRWSHYNDKIDTTEGITATRNGGPGYYEDSVSNQNLIFGISYLF